MVRECSDLRWGSLSQASRSGHLDSVISIQLSRFSYLDTVIAIQSTQSIAGQPAAATAAQLQSRLRSISMAAGTVARRSAFVVNDPEVKPAEPQQSRSKALRRVRPESGGQAVSCPMAALSRCGEAPSPRFTLLYTRVLGALACP
jgi:hypothetical protein